MQLLKDRKVFATRIAEMHDTCNTMMRDKFGRVVDLEKLETVTVNRGVEELKEKLRENETQCSRELSSWEVRARVCVCVCVCVCVVCVCVCVAMVPRWEER